jgi:hypothetical protein
VVTRVFVDRACASGLVSSLVISVLVKLTFSLRRLRRGGTLRPLRPTHVHCVHPDHDRDVAGAHMGHTAAWTTRALTRHAVAGCRMCNGWRQYVSFL